MGSYNWGKSDVTHWIKENFPEGSTCLDVGACDGIWHSWIGPHLVMDAVEAFGPNINFHNLTRKYRKVYEIDIDDFRYAHYDLIIFGDVIEHMEVEKAQRVLKYAWDRCDDMIIGVPYMYPQDELYGNPYEVHKQPDLTPEIFDERYPGFELIKGSYFYGYYHKRR